MRKLFEKIKQSLPVFVDSKYFLSYTQTVMGGIFLIVGERIWYYDILRIVSIFGVLITHISSDYWCYTSGFSWQVANFYDGLVRLSLPIFFMISGCIFINPSKTFSLKKIFVKNILRMIIAFLFWSVIYAIITIIKSNGEHKPFDIIHFLSAILNGEYHMWFLITMIGLYIALPVLRKIAENMDILKYFLIASFIFGIIIPTLQRLPIIEHTTGFYNKLHLTLFSGYTFYYLLGYYINNIIISMKHIKIIYALGIISIVLTIVLTSVWFVFTGHRNEMLFHALTPNIAISAIAVFIFAREHIRRLPRRETMGRIISKVSKLSFGIFLTHVLFIELFKYIGLLSQTSSPVIMIPGASLLVFCCGLLLTYLIDKIPGLNRYII